MERRRVRPQETRGNDDFEQPGRAGRIAPRMHRRGRASGPFGLRGKRHRHGHHTLVAAGRSLVEGAAPVKSVADRPVGTIPRGTIPAACACRHAPLRSLGWGLTRTVRAKRRTARSDGRGPVGAVPAGVVAMRAAGATLRVRLAMQYGQAATQSLLATSSCPPDERGAGIPSAGPGAPPKRGEHDANPPQLQAAPAAASRWHLGEV